MNRKILTILLILFTSYCFCQDVKKVVKKFDNSKQISESYYVLKSDKNIKHGEYISYFRYSDIDEKLIKNGIKKIEDFIKEKGNFYYGKKDGIWIEYVNKTEKRTGSYSNGKRVGIWNTYKENGRVIDRYDYDNNIQLEPIISIVIPYPDIAQENGIQGTVRIRFHINNDCSIDNITIIQSLSPECDKAAIDAMKILSDLSKKYSKKCVDTTIENDFKFKLY